MLHFYEDIFMNFERSADHGYFKGAIFGDKIYSLFWPIYLLLLFLSYSFLNYFWTYVSWTVFSGDICETVLFDDTFSERLFVEATCSVIFSEHCHHRLMSSKTNDSVMCALFAPLLCCYISCSNCIVTKLIQNFTKQNDPSYGKKPTKVLLSRSHDQNILKLRDFSLSLSPLSPLSLSLSLSLFQMKCSNRYSEGPWLNWRNFQLLPYHLLQP